MVASIHRYYHRSLPCRHVSCSAGAVFGPICVIYLDSTLFTERGEIMNLKKTKNGFLGQGCDTRITDKHSTQYIPKNMHVREVTR